MKKGVFGSVDHLLRRKKDVWTLGPENCLGSVYFLVLNKLA